MAAVFRRRFNRARSVRRAAPRSRMVRTRRQPRRPVRRMFVKARRSIRRGAGRGAVNGGSRLFSSVNNQTLKFGVNNAAQFNQQNTNTAAPLDLFVDVEPLFQTLGAFMSTKQIGMLNAMYAELNPAQALGALMHWDYVTIHFMARVNILYAEATAGTTRFTPLSIPGVEAYWIPNFDLDNSRTGTAGTSSPDEVTSQRRARPDKAGVYHFTVRWRNRMPRTQRGYSVPADTPALTPATPGAFPYTVTNYLNQAQLLNQSGNTGSGIANFPFAPPTATTAHGGTKLLASAGFPPSMIMRLPGMRIVTPAAFDVNTPLIVRVDLSYTLTGRCGVEGVPL